MIGESMQDVNNGDDSTLSESITDVLGEEPAFKKRGPKKGVGWSPKRIAAFEASQALKTELGAMNPKDQGSVQKATTERKRQGRPSTRTPSSQRAAEPQPPQSPLVEDSGDAPVAAQEHQQVSISPAAVIEDPFDPAAHRYRQDYDLTDGTTPILVSVTVGRPDKTKFYRVYDHSDYRMFAYVIEVQREIYLLAPKFEKEFEKRGIEEPALSKRLLQVAVDMDGGVLIWVIRVPDETGKVDSWNQSAMTGSQQCVKQWARLKPNQSDSSYTVAPAVDQSREPNFPMVPLRDLLRLGFANKLIDAWDNPVLKKLRGEKS